MSEQEDEYVRVVAKCATCGTVWARSNPILATSSHEK